MESQQCDVLYCSMQSQWDVSCIKHLQKHAASVTPAALGCTGAMGWDMARAIHWPQEQHHLSFCPQYLIPEDSSASVCLKGQKDNTCSSCMNHTGQHSSRPWQPRVFLMPCTQQMNPHLSAQHPDRQQPAEHQRANRYSSHYSIFSSSRCPLRPHCHNHDIW